MAEKKTLTRANDSETVKTTVRQAKTRVSQLFDTGLKSRSKAVILIPGRGRVTIAVPKGDVYFKGSYSKDLQVADGTYFKGSYTKGLETGYGLYFKGSYTKDLDAKAEDSGWGLHFRGSHTKDLQTGYGLYFKGSYTKDLDTAEDSGWGLHFRGSHTKDLQTGYVKDVSSATYTRAGYNDLWDNVQPSKPADGRIAITGILKKKDYLYLARRGCVIKDGIVTVPAEYLDAVRKYLKSK